MRFEDRTHLETHVNTLPTAIISSSSCDSVDAPSTGLSKEKNIIEHCATHLSPPSISHQNAFKSGLINLEVVPDSLDDLCPEKVPTEYNSAIVDDTPCYFRPRCLPPLQDDIMKEELSEMLNSRIISPSSSAWDFLMNVGTRKN